MTDNRTDTGQRGAAAVEFALVLPVPLLLIMGLIEFSLIFNSQISLTNAAREGARVMAIHNEPAAATSAAIAAVLRIGELTSMIGLMADLIRRPRRA